MSGEMLRLTALHRKSSIGDRRQAESQLQHLLRAENPKREKKRVAGIEPASSAWKAEVLPLNYTRADTHVPADGPGGTGAFHGPSG